jgi:hypothetical protein
LEIAYICIGIALAVLVSRNERQRGVEESPPFQLVVGTILMVFWWPFLAAILGWSAWSAWREKRRYAPKRTNSN